jgi:hypothetical protein
VCGIQSGEIRLELSRVLDLSLDLNVNIGDIGSVVVCRNAALLHAVPVHSDVPTIQVVGVYILLPTPLMVGQFVML